MKVRLSALIAAVVAATGRERRPGADDRSAARSVRLDATDRQRQPVPRHLSLVGPVERAEGG